jgi:transcriptional regulator with XRE-family HTH domain
VEPSADTARNFETLGRRVREARLKFGLSLSELSELAGVSRYTLIRVEQGKPARAETVRKLRSALHLFTDQLFRPFADGPYAVHRAAETKWSVSHSKASYQKQLEEDSRYHVNEAPERQRLGQLGFQPFFTAVLDSELTNGIASQALMEFYKPSWVDRHFGEEFVYCLRGSVTITVDGAPCVLEEGDAMSFDATRPHQYSPTNEVRAGELAPQVLIVVSRRPGERVPHPRD